MSEPSDPRDAQLETRLRQAARDIRYPPTPDVLTRGRRPPASHSRRLRLAPLLLLVALGAVLLAVPEVRAAALQLLRIGSVEIIPATPVPSAAQPVPTPQATTAPTTLMPTPTPLATDPLRTLRGATTLEQARAAVRFAIRLPSEPADLGLPDDVFVQDLGGQAAILVWREQADPARTRLALYILSDDIFARKMGVTVLRETTVNGQRAIWTSGPYLLQVGDAENWRLTERRLVEGNTLIWSDGTLSYRLESTLSLEEAVRVAESLQ